MIYFVVPAVQVKVNRNLPERFPALSDVISEFTLAEIARSERLPVGTYIFGGLELASPDGLRLACTLWNQLESSDAILFNDPHKFRPRYEQLRLFADAGINDFRVYRLSEIEQNPPRFPVFVRYERWHAGSLTGLIDSMSELGRSLSDLESSGADPDDLLVVEFLDTADERGIYRKYGAFVIGDRIVPQHIGFGRHWMNKRFPSDITLENDRSLILELTGEELAFITENSHESLIRPLFDLAEVDYGRIDYSLNNGSPVVWEINTLPFFGPTLEKSPDYQKPLRRLWQPGRDISDAMVATAFREIDCAPPSSPREIEIQIEEKLRRQVLHDEADALERAAQRSRISQWHKRVGRFSDLAVFKPIRKWAGAVLRRRRRSAR